MPPFDPLLIPAALGIVHVAEDVGMPTRLSPLLGLFAAIVVSFLIRSSLVGWQQTALEGLFGGLAAFGLYAAGPALARQVSRPAPALRLARDPAPAPRKIVSDPSAVDPPTAPPA